MFPPHLRPVPSPAESRVDLEKFRQEQIERIRKILRFNPRITIDVGAIFQRMVDADALFEPLDLINEVLGACEVELCRLDIKHNSADPKTSLEAALGQELQIDQLRREAQMRAFGSLKPVNQQPETVQGCYPPATSRIERRPTETVHGCYPPALSKQRPIAMLPQIFRPLSPRAPRLSELFLGHKPEDPAP